MEEIGYFGIFFYGLGGGFFAMATGAVFAAMGKLDPFLVFSIGLLSNYLSDLILFYGIKWNRELYQPTIANHRRAWAYARLLARKQGDWVIFIQKFMHVVKTIVPLSLGISGYPAKRFLILDMLASILWAVVVFALFYSLGESGELIVAWFEEYGWAVPLTVLAILVGFYYYLRHQGVFKKRKRMIEEKASQFEL